MQLSVSPSDSTRAPLPMLGTTKGCRFRQSMASGLLLLITVMAWAALLAPSAHAQIEPVLTCVNLDIGFPGYYEAEFGYFSFEPADVTIPVGSRNQFNVTVPGQPTLLHYGYQPRAAVVTALRTTNLTWNLDSFTATSSSVPGTAPLCKPTFIPTSASLSYTAAGTYPQQFLGYVDQAPASFPLTATVASAGPATNITVSNLQQQVPTSEPSGFSGDWAMYSQTPGWVAIYGDITVTPGPMGTANANLALLDSSGVVAANGLVPISFSGSPAPSTSGCPAVVTSSIQGTLGKPVQLFGTAIWTQVVTLKNISGATIAGPLQIALTNLSSNAQAFGAAGTATCPGISGAPYVYVTGRLAPNANAAVVLTFTNSQVPSSGITFTPVIVSGGNHL